MDERWHKSEPCQKWAMSRMCACVFVYTCMHICVCIYIYAYACVRVFLYIHICVCIYIYAYMYISIRRCQIEGAKRFTLGWTNLHILVIRVYSQSPQTIVAWFLCNTLQHTATHTVTEIILWFWQNHEHNGSCPPSMGLFCDFCSTVPFQHTAAHWETIPNPVIEIILWISSTMGLVPLL